MGCVYRPHKHTALDNFIDFMGNLCLNFNHIVIAAVFNSYLLNENEQVTKAIKLLKLKYCEHRFGTGIGSKKTWY